MKNIIDKMAVAIVLLYLCTFPGHAQERPGKRTVEIGLGGVMMNVNRINVSDFHQTAGGDYVFNLKEKQLYGGAELYAAAELKKWLYADLQGNVGFVRSHEAGTVRNCRSLLGGIGLQFRPFVKSEWIQPYFRVGLNCFHKNFPTSYFGQFEGDVTKEAVWKAEDAWNKGYTFDCDDYFPLSAGLGVIGWMGNRVGVRLQGQYFHSFGNKGANFAQASAGLVFRLGGNDKRKAMSDAYVPSNLADYDDLYRGRFPAREVVREVPVEKIVEKEVVKYNDKTLAELLDNVTFDFDLYNLTPESQKILDQVADVLRQFPDTRFMVAGYTDARGSYTYNETLSVNRAKAVYEALIQRNIPKSQLCFRGFGKRIAVVPASASDVQRRGDRKVVIERITNDALWEYLNR